MNELRPRLRVQLRLDPIEKADGADGHVAARPAQRTPLWDVGALAGELTQEALAGGRRALYSVGLQPKPQLGLRVGFLASPPHELVDKAVVGGDASDCA